MEKKIIPNVILLFDGYCNLCNGCVQYVLKREKTTKISFASLQSDVGQTILKQYNIDSTTVDSLVLIENNKAYIKSSAVLRLTKYMKGLYPLSIGFIIIPAFIRNWVYDYIARNRYRWFGKTDTCMVPDKNIANRFL